MLLSKTGLIAGATHTKLWGLMEPLDVKMLEQFWEEANYQIMKEADFQPLFINYNEWSC